MFMVWLSHINGPVLGHYVFLVKPLYIPGLVHHIFLVRPFYVPGNRPSYIHCQATIYSWFCPSYIPGQAIINSYFSHLVFLFSPLCISWKCLWRVSTHLQIPWETEKVIEEIFNFIMEDKLRRKNQFKINHGWLNFVKACRSHNQSLTYSFHKSNMQLPPLSVTPRGPAKIED